MKFLTNFLGGTLRSEAARPGPGSDFWYSPAGGVSSAGQFVNSDTAMRVAAVYACIKVLSETVAQLPLIIYRRLRDGSKERATDHPLYDVLRNRPNEWQTSFEYREMMMSHLAGRGNAYAEIISGRRGAVDQLIPLHPDRVRVKRTPNGKLIYEVSSPISPNDMTARTGGVRLVNPDFMHHWRGQSKDGIVGMNPIELERESIGMAMAAQDYAARFFQNDARPGGVLEHPAKLDEEAAKRLRDTWQSAQTAENRHKTAVLEEGMKYHQVGMTNRDAQFLDSRKYQDIDIARIFRMPPHKIGILDRSTFSNIEHQGIEFVVDTIGPWLVRIEQAISRDLIIADRTFFAEFLVDGLLRGDIKSRYDAYGRAILDGWMTRNEVRKRENMNDLPGLDEPLQPLNMAGVSETSGDEQESTLLDFTGKPLVAQRRIPSKPNGKGL